jgi:hypothetical protein
MATPPLDHPFLRRFGSKSWLCLGQLYLPAKARRGLLMTVAALLASTSAWAQQHTFTDVNGQTFSAQVLSVKNGEVVIRRGDGKVYSLELDTLSSADRKFVATWKANASNTTLATATTDSDIVIKVVVEPVNPGDVSLKIVKVTLVNQEDCLDFKGLKGTIILIGRQIDGADKYKVLALEKFSGDLPACGNYEYDGRPFDPTDAADDPTQPAYPYQGYLFVLQNSDGNIIQFKHSESFVKDGTEALKLRVGATFKGTGQRASDGFRLVTYPNS